MLEFSTLRFEKVLPLLEEKLKKVDTIHLTSNNQDIKAWSDLASILFCKITSINTSKNKLTLTLEKINTQKSFHKKQNIEEKYGQNSEFSTIDKMNQPAFLHYYLQGLKNVKIDTRTNILNLGINSGEEFEIIQKISGTFEAQNLTGIDYCSSAIELARDKFSNHQNVNFLVGDINNLDEILKEKYDLIITIGTLQSASLNFKTTFMNIIQNYLEKDGALIMGFPNCRWYDNEMIYGAKAPNYSFSEMSILYNDVIFCKKYLQQKKFRVTITGKEYIFLTATSIRKGKD
jgi:SAM-dependent methyltransferase